MDKEHCLNCKYFDDKNYTCHHGSPIAVDKEGKVESYYPPVYPNTVACSNHENANLSMMEAFEILDEFNKRTKRATALTFSNLDD